MKTFLTRDQLLDWLDMNAPTKAVQRGLHSGLPVVLLGGFKPVPNSNRPGWIIMVQTKTGREYYVAIAIGWNREPHAYLIDYIDWKDFCESEHPLYQGDIPEIAKKHRELGTVERVNEDGN